MEPGNGGAVAKWEKAVKTLEALMTIFGILTERTDKTHGIKASLRIIQLEAF
jgi:hypothetical protein